MYDNKIMLKKLYIWKAYRSSYFVGVTKEEYVGSKTQYVAAEKAEAAILDNAQDWQAKCMNIHNSIHKNVNCI